MRVRVGKVQAPRHAPVAVPERSVDPVLPFVITRITTPDGWVSDAVTA